MRESLVCRQDAAYFQNSEKTRRPIRERVVAFPVPLSFARYSSCRTLQKKRPGTVVPGRVRSPPGGGILIVAAALTPESYKCRYYTAFNIYGNRGRA
jgi:hypothetical protein